MKMYKKLITSICALSLFISYSFSSFAATYRPSEWATESIELAENYKIISDDTNKSSYTESITRSEFCNFAVNMYNSFSGKDMPEVLNSHFTDTNEKHILYAADLGIISGRGDGIFSPDDAITRQELSAVILRLLNACGVDTDNNDYKKIISSYKDSKDVASWAVDALGFCISNDIIKGMAENEIWPVYHTTREQAIVILCRSFERFAPDSIKQSLIPHYPVGDYTKLKASVTGDATLVSYNDRTLNIKFSPVKDAKNYKIDIWLDSSNFWYSEEDVFVKSIYSNKNEFKFENVRIGKKYKITVSEPDKEPLYTAYAYVEPLYSLTEKENVVFSHGKMDNQKQADNLMVKISPNVWRIDNNGNKYMAKAYFSVHKSIADITLAVFDEIFKSKSQFPIKDVGAYSWREAMSSGRYSHHNYGTAIDINYNENYCLYKDGTYVGVGWFPNENEHSINADSDVISIFSKYGFIWGGDEWSNPKDYMHFSYLEL